MSGLSAPATFEQVAISYEFFPSRMSGPESPLTQTVETISETDPWLVSVTYGADGSSRHRTLDAVHEVAASIAAPVMPHMVCAGHTENELRTSLGEYERCGVRYILALAGDEPASGSKGELKHATELVELIRGAGDFTVGVAANPEQHPLSPDLETDRARLADKLRSAHFGITQFFFEADTFHRLLDDMDGRGIATPIVPGLLLSTRFSSIRRMSEAAGVSIPDGLYEQLDRADRADTAAGNRKEVTKVVVDHATKLGGELIAEGSNYLHLFTLNQAKVTRSVLENLELIK
jgi:methylenetetrahydrofolate reductase (NADPH)